MNLWVRPMESHHGDDFLLHTMLKSIMRSCTYAQCFVFGKWSINASYNFLKPFVHHFQTPFENDRFSFNFMFIHSINMHWVPLYAKHFSWSWQYKANKAEKNPYLMELVLHSSVWGKIYRYKVSCFYSIVDHNK